MLVIPQTYLFKSVLLPFILLIIIELVLKGIALYKAGSRGEIGRFICLFIFNTCGILPLIYLLIINEKQRKCECTAEIEEEKHEPQDIKDTKETKVVKAVKAKVAESKKKATKPAESTKTTKKGKAETSTAGKKEPKKATKKK